MTREWDRISEAARIAAIDPRPTPHRSTPVLGLGGNDERWIEYMFDRFIAGMEERRRQRVKRAAERERERLRREAMRIDTCVMCGGPLPAGARADARTCSDRCRQALSRQVRAKRPKPSIGRVVGCKPGCTSARRSMGKHIDSITNELTTQVRDAWDVPMPDGYDDEPEWRRTQASALLRMARDERAAPRPLVTRFRKRARTYIKRMKELAKENR